MTVAERIKGLAYRNEIAVLVILMALVPVLPHLSNGGPRSVPFGVVLLGVVAGSSLAMQAIGVVLVFRANRFINFGQVYLGGIAARIFVLSSQYQPLYRWIGNVCPPCVGETTDGMYKFNYWLSLAVSLLLAVGVSWLVYVLIVKRFEGQPRLVVTVASIFMGSAAVAVGGFLRNTLTTVQDRESGPLTAVAPLPFDWRFSLGGAEFHATDVFTVVAAVLTVGGLWLYLSRSAAGTAIRASADSPGRAQTLGINVASLNARVWLIVGLLAGIPAILGPMAGSPVGFNEVSTDVVVRVLVVAVVARFVSLPMAGAAAIVLGIVDQATKWSFNGSGVFFDAGIVVLIAGLLLLRLRQREGRASDVDAAGWRATREIRPIPRELRDLPSVRSWLRAGAGIGVVMLLGLPWVLSPGQTNLAASVLIYAIVGLSLLILTGWAGQVSLGQFAFAAIGGYVVAVTHLPFLLALVAGSLVGGAVATLVGIPALRIKGLYLAVSTLALAVSVTSVLLSPRYLGRHLPDQLSRPSVLGMRFDDQRVFYYFTAVVLAGVVVAVIGLRRSRLGRALIASRENEQAAQSFGIGLVRARLTAFAISGMLAALAGGLFAYHQHGVPVGSFNEQQSLTMFIMTVVGGLGSVSGPLIGAAYQGILIVFETSPAVTAFFLGFGGLTLLLLAPGGLSQVIFGLRDSLLRRIAKRNRIAVPSLISDGSAVREDGKPPIAPKLRRGGWAAFTPQRYALTDQWALAAPGDDVGGARTTEFHGMAQDAPTPESVGG